jgi:Uma2 family endonuclease
MATIPDHPDVSNISQPAWDVALLFPGQGDWSENEFLALDTNRLVELIDGNLDVLPMPTYLHQLILEFLFDTFREFVVRNRLGKVMFAGLPVYIRDNTFREPDIVFFTNEQTPSAGERYLKQASLVVEVVSPDDKFHKRDYEHKRRDYAAIGIPEYWIVDPQLHCVTVLTLDGKRYRLHGEFKPGQIASSILLAGFTVDVSAVFEAGTEAT